jgi:hypothetical protein
MAARNLGLSNSDRFLKLVNPDLYRRQKEYAEQQGEDYNPSAGERFRNLLNPDNSMGQVTEREQPAGVAPLPPPPSGGMPLLDDNSMGQVTEPEWPAGVEQEPPLPADAEPPRMGMNTGKPDLRNLGRDRNWWRSAFLRPR